MAEEGRREKDLSLVEDFETVRAITSDGRSVRVPKSKFASNLDVASANVLGGIKADTKTDAYNKDVRIDPSTGRLFVEAGEGTPPDDEDITLAEIEGAEKLRFKDKKYNKGAFSGLGRCYLRKNVSGSKNVLTQAMFNNEDGSVKSNTRYVIQYEYDLNGATITIPSGCVLDFQGGSFSNGTVKGDNFHICTLNSYIFKNVLFEGQVKESYKFKIDWFIPEEYTNSASTKSDCSSIINSVLNSGIKNVEFSSNKFYYVKSTISVNNKEVKLFSDNDDLNWQHSSRTTTGLRGCIFSDTVVTILDYKYKSESNFEYTPYIGNLTFLCLTSFSTSDKTTTPIVKFTNNNYYEIWGMVMNCNVYARQLAAGPLNYTGIEINAPDNGQSIAFITMKGNIQQTYYGIRLLRGSSRYINGVDIYGNTRCVVGGVIQANAVQIFGGHQPVARTWEKNEWLESAYFETQGWISIYNYVWDVNHNVSYTSGRSFTVRSTIKNTKSIRMTNNDDYIHVNKNKLFETNKESQLPVEKYLNGHNILNKFVTPNKPRLASEISYTINGEDITTTSLVKLYNSHILFNGETNLGLSEVINPYVVDVDNAAVSSSSNLDAAFEVNMTLYKNAVPIDEQGYVPLVCRGRQAMEITIKNVDDGTVLDQLTSDINSMYYYNSAVYIEDLFRGKTIDTLNITIKFNISMTANQIYSLPHISIPIGRHQTINCGSLRPIFNTINNDKQIGFCYYDTTLSKPVWWTGSKWVDATGANV